MFEDFEEGNFDKWNFLLNQQGIQVVTLEGSGGNRVAEVKVKGSDDFLWNDDPALNRSELQHKPIGIEEGATSSVSWKFMLPELFSDSRHKKAR